MSILSLAKLKKLLYILVNHSNCAIYAYHVAAHVVIIHCIT